MKGKVFVGIFWCLAILLILFLLFTNEGNLIGVWSDGGDATLEFKSGGEGEANYYEEMEILGDIQRVPQTVYFKWNADKGKLNAYIEVMWEEIEIFDDVRFFVIGDTLIIIQDGEIGVAHREWQ